jgi:uncharacterized protein (TIGR03067 family)
MFLSKVKMVVAVVLALAVVGSAAVGVRQALADKPAATDKETDKKDEEKVLGTWAVVSVEEGGHREEGEGIKEARMTFAADGKWIWKTPGKGGKDGTYKGTYTLDPAKKPKEVTVTINNGETIKGIYKVDGDSLTICSTDKDIERPSEFITKEGMFVTLIVLKREKK